MRKLAVLVGVFVLMAACGPIGIGNFGGGGGTGNGGGSGGGSGGNGGNGGSGGGAMGGGSGNFTGLNCQVADLLAAKCVSCHGSPLSGSAPFPLMTRDELMAASPSYPGQSVAQRSVARMQDTASPMPPGGGVTSGDVSAVQSWINAGMSAETCGTAPDAGPAPTTCASNSFWSGRYSEGSGMNPGLACKACHAGQNFDGQNPAGRAAFGELYTYMGTLFPAYHEKDFCRVSVPAGVVLQILDAAGNATQTINVSSNRGGNFYADGLTSPYRARITYNGKSVTMTNAQTNGDCNTCHTEQGLNGAPGRLVWPQ